MASEQTQPDSPTTEDKSQVETETIYVLQNPAMPNYVKIGKTENLQQRIKDLDNKSVPVPFECIYAACVKKGRRWEKVLHEVFSEYRVNQRREFFTSENVVVKAIRILKAAQIKPVDFTATNALIVADDPDEEISVREGQKRIARNENKRVRFDFAMVGIPDDATLTFLLDDEVVCTVRQQKNPPKVNFLEEELSLSMAAAKALGRDSSAGVRGPAYWKYKDELLSDIRDRRESKEGENADEE